VDSVREIKQAIDRLSPAERYGIAMWILESWESGDHVAEPAPAYNTALENRHLSVADYLDFEARASKRHEYVAGEIFAMAGVSQAHNLIVGNVYRAFANRLHGGPCRTFFSDFKVRLKINMDEFFYYPDVMVACGSEGVEKYFLRNPKVIVEVLSPSTEGTDRREKLIHYRRIPALEEYILIAQDTPEVTIHRRGSEWKPTVLTALDAVGEIHSIKLSLPLAEVYDGVHEIVRPAFDSEMTSSGE
jgi:Uma2 family endonuclease